MGRRVVGLALAVGLFTIVLLPTGASALVTATCTATTNPCGTGGKCVATDSGWSCACGAGWVSTGGLKPTCVNQNACTAAATSSCMTNIVGNSCVDEAPPSTGYHCACSAAGYAGTGTTRCADFNACVQGNGNASCQTAIGGNACVDEPAPSTGFRCTCGAGFAGTGGTSCTDFNACTAGGGNTSCMVSAVGNSCTDDPAPSTGFHCTCKAPGATAIGTTACDVNACIGGGNASCQVGVGGNTCIDDAPPSPDYHCSCGPGFTGTGTKSCTGGPVCSATSNPCGSGGTCTASGTSWTCACAAGYVSSGGTQPTCVNFNACTATALSACQTNIGGNTCIDEPPPSSTYHCACSAVGYIGTGTQACTK